MHLLVISWPSPVYLLQVDDIGLCVGLAEDLQDAPVLLGVERLVRARVRVRVRVRVRIGVRVRVRICRMRLSFWGGERLQQ